jgi:hypothetical protein
VSVHHLVFFKPALKSHGNWHLQPLKENMRTWKCSQGKRIHSQFITRGLLWPESKDKATHAHIVLSFSRPGNSQHPLGTCTFSSQASLGNLWRKWAVCSILIIHASLFPSDRYIITKGFAAHYFMVKKQGAAQLTKYEQWAVGHGFSTLIS